MTEPSAPPLAPPRRRRWWRYVVLTLLLVIGPPVGWYFYNRYAADRELQAAIAEVDAADPGWRLEELLERRPPIPADKNSAKVVIAARRLLPRNWNPTVLGTVAETPPPVSLRPDQEAVLRADLEPLATALAEARKLADYPRGRFAITYAPDWLSTIIEELQQTREVAALLQLDTWLALHDSEPERAWRSCHAVLNTARSIDEEPGLIPMLIRIAVETITVTNVERCLAQGEVKAPALAAMQKALEEEAAENLFLTGIRGERAGMHRLLSNVEAGHISLSGLGNSKGGGSPGFWESLGELRAMPMVMRSHAWLLRLETKAVEASKLGGFEKYRAIKELDTEAHELDKRRESDLVFAALLLPAIFKVSASERRTDTLLHCAAAGLAAERFRLEHKRWPKSLDELVKAGLLKEAPLDLFDGRPVRLRRAKDGLVVHSACKWNGAENWTLDYQGDALDDVRNFSENLVRIEFRLWDPEYRRQPPLPPRAEPEGEPPPEP